MSGSVIPLSLYPNDSRLLVRPSRGHGIVYKITPNEAVSKTGKTGYVGITTLSPKQRLKEHVAISSGCHAIHAALKKHGVRNFTFEVLEAEVPIDRLREAEKKWVAVFDTYERGYNLTRGGEDNPMNNPDTREKHRKVMSSREFVTKSAVKRNKTFKTDAYKTATSAAHVDAWKHTVDRAKHKKSVLKSWEGDRKHRRAAQKKAWDDESRYAKQRDGMKLHFQMKKDPTVTQEMMKEHRRLRTNEAAARYREKKRAQRA
tara:strand:- start:1250 stop:2026 length:777 start_codon:yes stop_codon:yes gene_type:complete